LFGRPPRSILNHLLGASAGLRRLLGAFSALEYSRSRGGGCRLGGAERDELLIDVDLVVVLEARPVVGACRTETTTARAWLRFSRNANSSAESLSLTITAPIFIAL